MTGPGTAPARTLEGHRGDILTESALVLAFYVVTVIFVNSLVPRSWIADPGLHWALSFLLSLTASILLVGLLILVAKFRTHLRLTHRTELEPETVSVLTRITRGEANAEELRPLFARDRRVVEEILADTLTAQKGSGKNNVAAAAEVLGIPARWRRRTGSADAQIRCTSIIRLGLLPDPRAEAEFRRGLGDDEELVALESARALIRSGHRDTIDSLCRELPRQTRMVRALLCEWLRRHSVALAATAIPEMLRSEEKRDVLAALEMLSSWRRALPLPDLRPLLMHSDPAIRELSWSVLPFALGLEISFEEFRAALTCAHAAVRAAAWATAARLRVPEAVQLIPAGMRDPDTNVSLAACYAAPALGLRTELERTAAGGEPCSVYATEALEKFMIGRIGQ